MIKFFFYLILSLTMIVFQTSVFPSISFFYHCFDLMLIIILAFSLMFSNFAMIVAVLLIGLCMDSLSGAPLGLYTIAYVWIFILVQFLKRFVHSKNIIFMPCISAVSVIMEHLFLFFSFFIRYGREAFPVENILIAGEQSLWAFFLVPIFIVIIHNIDAICGKLDAKGVV